MNSTNVMQVDGGTRIKQGDSSSRFVYELQDEQGQKLALAGQAELALVRENQRWQRTLEIEDGQVSFQISDVLPLGTYTVEIRAGGYVFPSDRRTKIHVVKSEVDYVTDEVARLERLSIADEVQAVLTKQNLQGVTDERLQALIEANLPHSLTRDDVASLVRELAPTQPSPPAVDLDPLKQELAQIKTVVEVLKNRPEVQSYDDSPILTRISALENKTDKDTVYDDRALSGRIEALERRPSNSPQLVIKNGRLEISGGNSVALSELSSISTHRTEYVLNRLMTTNDFIMGDSGGYENQTKRRLLTVNGLGLGIIHLDFTPKLDFNRITTLFTLPNDAPTPLSLLEVQVHDGNTIWIEGNGRQIKVKKLAAKTRYIVDIIGFFKI